MTTPSNHLRLILGGARSGKSTRAVTLASTYDRVLFVATAEARDDEMRVRIARHQAERPASWHTLEEPRHLAAVAEHASDHDVVIIDCLTLWVSNLMLGDEHQPGIDDSQIESSIDDWLRARQSASADWIVVSNEVGLGIVPAVPIARRYRDVLGNINRRVAAAADTVELLVAGLPLMVKPAPSSRASLDRSSP